MAPSARVLALALTLTLTPAGFPVGAAAAPGSPATGSPAADPATAPLDAIPAVNARDGLALQGYDPVAYFTRGVPTRGDQRYTFVWQQVTWRFESAASRELFAADPARYAPQYGGYCAYAISMGRIADIDPERWDVVDGRLYLNNNWLARSLWSVNRADHIRTGDAHWAAVPRR